MAPDGRLYQPSRKGELFELKQGLNATTMKERKTTLKRTVAAMTLGKDVSSLFTDVVKNTAGDISMKKLVYLYIINYAPTNPDLAILIVNTFIKDAVDPDPLIRALAIRTMALIPLDRITEYLCEPLHAAIKDQDPYVRKTAAVCVAKLYETNAAMAAEEGFVTELQELLADGNPMVVSNAVAALSNIAQLSRTPGILALTSQTVPRFLSAIAECTEWGQVFILDAIAAYTPSDAEEADLMVERIVPRLQHANPAVVLSAIRNIVNLMPRLDADEKRMFLVKKMSAPLVTLLKGKPEMQFVALRNIELLVRAYPTLLSGDVRVFFVSYADPLYVKREKLNILVKLTDPTNIDEVLTELMEYTAEVDVSFVQQSVDCVARISLRMPAYAGRCVSLFSELLQRNNAHITEQVAVGLKDILRAHPDQYDEIIIQLCKSAEDIEDPTAKASLVWIIGEHANRIPNAVAMLNLIAESIHEETVPVQLQILTACVKTYLLRGPEAQQVADSVIEYATQESEHVDIRDRGFIYQRLIGGGYDAAQQVVLSNKQGIDSRNAEPSEDLQRELLASLSTIAAVYHKPGRSFEGARRKCAIGQPIGDVMAEEDLLGIDDTEEDISKNATLAAIAPAADHEQKAVGDTLLDDILGVSPAVPAGLPAPPCEPPADDLLSSLGMGALTVSEKTGGPQEAPPAAMRDLLNAERGKGLSIRGCLSQESGGSFVLDLELGNSSQTPMTGFAVQLNKNAFGFVLAAPMNVNEPLAPGAKTRTLVSLRPGGASVSSMGMSLQVAIKFAPGGVVYFAEDISDHISSVFDRQGGLLTKPLYLSTWKSVPDTDEVKSAVDFGSNVSSSAEQVSRVLAGEGVFTVAKRMSAKPPVMYLSSVVVGGGNMVILGELTLPLKGQGTVGSIASRSTIPPRGNTDVLKSFNRICADLLSR